MKKVLFIINKFSGAGFRESLEGRIIDYCARQGWECTLEFTRQRGHAVELAQQGVAEQVSLVVATGGDGTVNEVARGMVNTHIPMAILPKGSGNGLARHLGLPVSFQQALQQLHLLQPRAIDTMQVNGHLSINVSGIGFDGHIANLFGNDGRRGLANYTRLTLREFVRFQEFESEITLVDCVIQSRQFLIALANSSQFGNNARIAPLASVCDQQFDLSLVKKVPLHHALGFARNMFAGRLDRSRFVTLHKATKATIRLQRPMAFHVDGEPLPAASQFEVQVNPLSLLVCVPKDLRKKI
ncbi:MAG: diacylglycerol/lipid kinase family protein [Bacteroidota bacterium]